MVTQVRNKLLRLIPPDELSRVLRLCERIELAPRQILHHYKLPMEYVYFVERGLVSVAAKVGRDKFVEVWLIGAEGLVGAPVVLAANAAPLHRRTVQVAGAALRIRARDFCRTLESLPQLRSLVQRYLAVVLVQTSQSGACNSYHGLKHRLARWLLVARAALADDEIPLTHRVLAELLGVRRASVTDCLVDLQNEGTISTRRGFVKVENHAGLSNLCCDCFRLIETAHRRLVPSAAANDFRLEAGARPIRPASLGMDQHASSRSLRRSSTEIRLAEDVNAPFRSQRGGLRRAFKE